MLFLSLLLSVCLATTKFYTTRDWSFTNGDMTCRRDDGSYLYRINTRSYAFGHEFALSAEPSGNHLVRAKRQIKWNPKTWLMRKYELEYLVGDQWLTAVIKRKWFIDFRAWKTFDLVIGNETFTAKGAFFHWKFALNSHLDQKEVASVGLSGQDFFRWGAPNAQTYVVTVDETRINPALVASLLAIVEMVQIRIKEDTKTRNNVILSAGIIAATVHRSG